MTFFLIALCLSFVLGYLAQFTGLCMVRGVNEWKNGNPSFLLAILFSGVLAWVAAVAAFFLGLPLQFNVYKPSILFVVGGVLFGVGAALNKGCGVSTLTRLSRGDIVFSATVLGWLSGWILLSTWRPDVAIKTLPLPTNLTYGILIVLSIGIGIWALFGNRQRRTTWFGMMGIGLLGGFLFLYHPNWPPSGLLHDLSRAIIDKDDAYWPDLTRYLLFISLLMGMCFYALKSKQFLWVFPRIKYWFVHFLAGNLMGIGASMAMGGNDSQLLLALPTFSLAGLITVVGMIVGIFLAIEIGSIISKMCNKNTTR